MTSDALARGRFCEKCRPCVPTSCSRRQSFSGTALTGWQILAGATTQSGSDSSAFASCSQRSEAGGTLVGYDQRSASTYVWLGQALLASIAIFGWIGIAEPVSSGEIAVDFPRRSTCSWPDGHATLGALTSSCSRAASRPCSSVLWRRPTHHKAPQSERLRGPCGEGDQATVAVSSGMSSHAAR
jgi:hypothetical protein